MTKIEVWYELKGQTEPENDNEILKEGKVFVVLNQEFEEEDLSDFSAFMLGMGILFNSDWPSENNEVKVFRDGVWLEHV